MGSIKGVTTQKELNNYNYELGQAYNYEIPNHARGLMFKARLYSWMFFANMLKNFPSDFHPFIPGLEMSLAV